MPLNPNFVGPSYNLDSLPSGVQRTINMVPVPQEPGNERTGWVFKDAPGLEAFSLPFISSFRYWRLDEFSGFGSGGLETQEIQLLEGATVRSQGILAAAIAFSQPDQTFENKALLCDGDVGPPPSKFFQWQEAQALILAITFDLTTPYAIDGVKIARWQDIPRCATSCRLSHSDDGVTWVVDGTGAITNAVVPYALSDLITFA